MLSRDEAEVRTTTVGINSCIIQNAFDIADDVYYGFYTSMQIFIVHFHPERDMGHR